MMLQGMRYRVHSPSLFELEGFPVAIILSDRRQWHIWTAKDGLLDKPLATRDQAATIVANAFRDAGAFV